jgi:hypothetical protein
MWIKSRRARVNSRNVCTVSGSSTLARAKPASKPRATVWASKPSVVACRPSPAGHAAVWRGLSSTTSKPARVIVSWSGSHRVPVASSPMSSVFGVPQAASQPCSSA